MGAATAEPRAAATEALAPQSPRSTPRDTTAEPGPATAAAPTHHSYRKARTATETQHSQNKINPIATIWNLLFQDLNIPIVFRVPSSLTAFPTISPGLQKTATKELLNDASVPIDGIFLLALINGGTSRLSCFTQYIIHFSSHASLRFLMSSSSSCQRKAMTNLDSILRSRDITLSTKVHLVKAMVFPVVMYGCESWTIKEAEHKRIDAFELWCWRRLLRVPWTARRSNQSI